MHPEDVKLGGFLQVAESTEVREAVLAHFDAFRRVGKGRIPDEAPRRVTRETNHLTPHPGSG
jgi:hypothetical protein